MIENVIESGLAMARVRAAVDNVGLSATEIEVLLGLAPGRWNGFAMGEPMTAMTKLQETRARLAVELLNSLCDLLATEREVGEWLRLDNPVLEYGTPLEWSAASLDNLRAMACAIRRERHDAQHR